MRCFALLLASLLFAGCAVPVQTMRPPVTHTYELRERRQVIDGFAALLAAGWTVRVLDNFSTGKRSNLPADRRLVVIEGDIRDDAERG